jgi:SAM-dependent methyltransferase
MAEIEPARSQTDYGLYRCPVTGAELTLDGSRLRAGPDGPSYDLEGDVPRFLRFDPVESPEETARLQGLNEAAVREGWRKAIELAYAESPGQVRYNTDVGRLKALDLLPLDGEDVVLEIGPALGHWTVELARRTRRVYALEVVPGQARFVVERCRQEGLDNVSVACGGDDCRLPYADGAFDAVVINLVFEWCANRLADEPFQRGQERLLAEMFRVLRPGGRAFLSTKNRYAIKYMIGNRDEHVSMRFGNALPRWLMNLMLKSRGGRPMGRLYSHDQLRELLRRAGFVRPASYWAAPEMRYPHAYVPTDAASVREARSRPGFVQGDSRSTKLLTPLFPAGLVKHVTPGLLFVVEKPA